MYECTTSHWPTLLGVWIAGNLALSVFIRFDDRSYTLLQAIRLVFVGSSAKRFDYFIERLMILIGAGIVVLFRCSLN